MAGHKAVALAPLQDHQIELRQRCPKTGTHQRATVGGVAPVLAGVHLVSGDRLPEVGYRGRVIGAPTGTQERGKRKGHEHSQNGQDHQDFDEGKP